MKDIIYILLVIGLSSCVTQERCYSKFPPTTETETKITIEYRDTLIQGGTITQIIKHDSLVFLPGEVRRYVDTSGSAMLSFYKNEFGQLVAKCEAKDKTIKSLNKDIRERQTTVKILPPIKERYIPWYVIASLSITSLMAIPTAFKAIKLFI